MSFQREVRQTMRTAEEIAAEKQGTIMVYPCASATATECFPCIAIEVFRAGQPPQKTWLDLRKIGKHFDTLDAAVDAARKVRVLSVTEDGEVRWEVEPE